MAGLKVVISAKIINFSLRIVQPMSPYNMPGRNARLCKSSLYAGLIQSSAGCILLSILAMSQPVSGQTETYDPNSLYSVASLKADLSYLKSKITKMHPGLYRYTPKANFDHFWDSLHNAVNRPMNHQEFLAMVTLLNEKIRNGHTMFLPGTSAMTYNNTRGRFFPFSVRYVEGKLVVEENNSADSTITRGAEILHINGLSTATIMSRLQSRQIRDGYNQTYARWILDQYFPSYYSFTFGQPAQFTMQLSSPNRELYEKYIRSLPKDSIAYFRQIRYGNNALPVNAAQGIALTETTGNKAAILKIKSFDPDILKYTYGQDYKRTIDSLFYSLKSNKTTSLILDLRDNQGGDFLPARYLLSYLTLKPTRFLLEGEQSRLIEPKANHFKGRLIVLINGGSYSSTAMVAATLERDKRAVFIGEETGGNKIIITGNPVEVVLPHTKIRCYISTTTYRIVEGINHGHGVLPTYEAIPAMEDIREKRDRALEMAFKLIAEN